MKSSIDVSSSLSHSFINFIAFACTKMLRFSAHKGKWKETYSYCGAENRLNWKLWGEVDYKRKKWPGSENVRKNVIPNAKYGSSKDESRFSTFSHFLGFWPLWGVSHASNMINRALPFSKTFENARSSNSDPRPFSEFHCVKHPPKCRQKFRRRIISLRNKSKFTSIFYCWVFGKVRLLSTLHVTRATCMFVAMRATHASSLFTFRVKYSLLLFASSAPATAETTQNGKYYSFIFGIKFCFRDKITSRRCVCQHSMNTIRELSFSHK